MSLLIIGASGMVGHVLLSVLRKKSAAVTGIARRKICDDIVQLDLFNWESIKSFLVRSSFDVIINCSAVLVKESSARKSAAVYINSLFPQLLVDLFQNTATKVIHLSTGGVFSGNDDCYFNDSIVSPQNYYGITKAAGEFDNDKDLVIRSDFWGPDSKKNGTGLFSWFLDQQQEVKAYENVYFNGISNVELARIIMDLLDYSGIINIGSDDIISKGTFLEKVKNTFSLEVKLIPEKTVYKKVYVKNRSDLPRINCYDDMILDVRNYMDSNRTFYEEIYGNNYR